MRGIGFEDVTLKAIPHPAFVGSHEQIDRERAHHDDKRDSRDFRVIAAFDERSDRTRPNLIGGKDEHEPDHKRSEGLQLEMPVGVLFIGWTRSKAISMRPTTLPAESKIEWMPSACIAVEHEMVP